ncbi:hypothetical protein [Runella sp. SP2]|uniref:hypothetical protein n=1 Tax=Runella sp. SP2 TaxID=2268026 RepID=UPI000F08F92A|nr:hypothetical protein [Runella sp. SP2]AYQ35830.1 hypothetical protein DTQ70_28295 [Runella sp. SP2]
MKQVLMQIMLVVGIISVVFGQDTPPKPTPFAVSKHPFTYEGGQLIVGQSIGNLEKEYRLLEDGGIYRRINSAKELEVLGGQTPKNVATAFQSLKDIDFEKITFQHPSRISYFLIYKKGKKEHKVSWGDPKHPAPEGAVRVYKAFMGMIPKEMRL